MSEEFTTKHIRGLIIDWIEFVNSNKSATVKSNCLLMESMTFEEYRAIAVKVFEIVLGLMEELGTGSPLAQVDCSQILNDMNGLDIPNMDKRTVRDDLSIFVLEALGDKLNGPRLEPKTIKIYAEALKKMAKPSGYPEYLVDIMNLNEIEESRTFLLQEKNFKLMIV